MSILRLESEMLTDGLAQQLGALFGERAWPSGYYPYEGLTTVEGWLTEGYNQLRSGQMVSFVCLSGRRIAGHAALIFHDDYWESGRWAVDPDFQGRGIGRYLAQSCTIFAQKQGIPWLVVGCSYYQRLSELICRGLGMICLGVNPNIYHRQGALWGETLFLWDPPSRRALTSGWRDLAADGPHGAVVGVWPGHGGEWQVILAERLPPLELKKPVGRLRGWVPIHTTVETAETLRGFGWSV